MQSSHPLMPLYVGVAAMCASRKSILSGACEYAEVRRTLPIACGVRLLCVPVHSASTYGC